MPRRPAVRFDRLIPIAAAGVPIGSIDGELLEAVARLARQAPRDETGAPLSTEDVLARVQRALKTGRR